MFTKNKNASPRWTWSRNWTAKTPPICYFILKACERPQKCYPTLNMRKSVSPSVSAHKYQLRPHTLHNDDIIIIIVSYRSLNRKADLTGAPFPGEGLRLRPVLITHPVRPLIGRRVVQSGTCLRATPVSAPRPCRYCTVELI